MVTFTQHKLVVRRVSQCFNDPSVCDVTVYGPNGDVYHCLRFNLCLSSEIFRQMLSGENGKELHVHDVDSAALRHVLQFLHTGECEVTDENIIPLTAAAEMYEVAELSELCNTYKREHLRINERNCCYLLEDATDYGSRDIGEECREYITRNMKKVCERTEFLLMDFEVIQGIGVHAEESLFRSREEGAGDMCMWVVLGLIKWMERDLPRREMLKMDLLWNLDLAPLAPEQMACICRCDIIRRSPELSMSVIDALASMTEKKAYKVSYPGHCLKTFDNRGYWETWHVETSGWYTVIAKDATEEKPSRIKIYKGLSNKVEGGNVSGGGGFYFERGDEVRSIVGVGSNPSCVIVKSQKTRRDKMVLVAGGDLSMAFSNDEEACNEAQLTVMDKSAHSQKMLAPNQPGPVFQCSESKGSLDETSPVVAPDSRTKSSREASGLLPSEWGTIGYPVSSHDKVQNGGSGMGKLVSITPLAIEDVVNDLPNDEPSFKFLPYKCVSQSKKSPRHKSKKIFPRVDGSKVRKRWKRFVEVVRG